EKGLVKLETERLDQTTRSFQYLTKKSGLTNDKIDFLLKVRDSIWAFSANNFSVIPESFARFTNDRPRFYIEDIQVNNAVKPAAHLASLHHRENTLQIKFGFISFNNQNLFLRYKLSE